MSLFRYDYTSFGISISTGTIALDAPFRFSSEYYDKTLDLVYYNYRYYNPRDGRWCNRDQIAEEGGINLQSFLANNPISLIDDKGMVAVFPVVIATFTANIIPTFLCAYPQYKYVMRSHPGTGDKFKHCLTSCRIAKSCGGTIAELAGLGKEARDRFVSYVCKNFSSLQNSDFCNGGHGDFFDSMRDIEANHQCVGWESYAFGPVGGWIGTLFRQPCECCCEREVGREH